MNSLLGTFIMILTGAQASTDIAASVADNFRKVSLEIPNSLIDQHFDDFGPLKLSELQTCAPNEVKVVDRFSRPEMEVGGLEFERRYAMWEVDENGHSKVTIAALAWNSASHTIRSVVGLHERMGICGRIHKYNDHGYGPSSGLWVLHRALQRKAVNSDEIRALRSQIMQMVRGTFGVGGGGDGEGVEPKLMILNTTLQHLASGADRGNDLQQLLEELRIGSEVGQAKNQSLNRVLTSATSQGSNLLLTQACLSIYKEHNISGLQMAHSVGLLHLANVLVSNPEEAIQYCRENIQELQ
jgi:hypothetical protein